MSHSIKVWDRAEPLKRCRVKLPNRRRNPGAVVVDQDIGVLCGAVTGKMDLPDHVRRQGVQISDRVEPEVVRADVDVIDVAEDSAAGSAGGFGEELRLGDGRMAKAQVG